MTLHNDFTKREQDVIKHLLEGKSNKQIAASLNITERTVEFHLKNIYEKSQVSSRVELVLKLGSSTVAGAGAMAENRDRLSLRYWAEVLRNAVSNLSKELSMESTLPPNARGAGRPLTFFEAIRVCLVRYAEFAGRATRAEFWWFTLFVVLVAGALTYLSEVAANIFLIAVLLPWLAAGTRRLRDSGQNPWWQLFLLVPVGGLVALAILWARPSVGPLPADSGQA